MQEFKLNSGETAILIKRIPGKKALISFKSDRTPENYTKIVRYSSLIDGSVRNPYYPTVYGVGYIGDKTRKDNPIAYNYWVNLLNRCYYRVIDSYQDCSVCDEWLCFSNFLSWFELNYIEGYSLDKDILVKGNKIYCPSKCCFVPQEINSLLTKTNKKRGKYKIGVSLLEDKYYKVGFSKYGVIEYFGIYCTEDEAFSVYKREKEKYIKEISENYFSSGKITRQVYEALIKYEVSPLD